MISVLGLAESSFYPGMQYVIGSWYRKDELAKRSCIFHVSSAIATMCSGYLMAAVYHLGGRGGFAGWQWSIVLKYLYAIRSGLRRNSRLFIVDGIISLPIALAGYLFIPDVPETTRAFFLSKDVCGSFRHYKPNIETEFRLLGSSICQKENAARRS